MMSEERLTLAELVEIEQRAGQATGGPWQWQKRDEEQEADVVIPCEDADTGLYYIATIHSYEEKERADAMFIAHSRHDVPTLTAELRRAWEALAWLRESAEMAASEPGPQVLAVDVLCQIVRILPEDWPR